MQKPAIIAVDDDPSVLSAVARDLRHQYSERFRILRAESGEAALEAVRQLKLRDEPIALFLVDQRMPVMTGVEFLEQAKEVFPETKRVLLTAYADIDAAIEAINEVQIDYYLLKPWEPPEERLYPILDDLLDDWQAAYRPAFEGIRVIGMRWSPPAHQTKEFLARNQLPYRWLDIETDDEAQQLMEQIGADGRSLPVVVFPDGTTLMRPSMSEIAAKVGLRLHAEQPFYDLVIVGAGPAGLGAAVYAASEGLKTVLVEREAAGGQAGTSSRIENYLGFPSGLSGAELTRRAVTQARRFGAEILSVQEVTGLRIDGPSRIVTLTDGTEVGSQTVLIATGVSYRRLDAPGIERLMGAGVYYGGALSEAFNAQGSDVFIVGGGNSAGQAAMYFSRFAAHVSILVRGPSLASSMSQYLIDQISATDNIEVCTRASVVEAHGENRLEAITIENTATHSRETMSTNGLFLFIGARPHTEWLDGVIMKDPGGFIMSGADLVRNGQRPPGWMLDRDPFPLETSEPGVFVAGDVRHRSMKRIASAVGEGAMAVSFIHQYLGTK
jgi:thioredoxin reductase (NADPH)